MAFRELTERGALRLVSRETERECLTDLFHGERHQRVVAYGLSASSDLEHVERGPFPADYRVRFGFSPGTKLIIGIPLALPHPSPGVCMYVLESLQ